MSQRTQDLINTISAISLLIVLALGVVAIAGKLIVTKATDGIQSDYVYREVMVEPGDTLWSIARAQVPDDDPRDVVGSMRDLNQLTSADIFPGQRLTVLVKQEIQPLQVASGNLP